MPTVNELIVSLGKIENANMEVKIAIGDELSSVSHFIELSLLGEMPFMLLCDASALKVIEDQQLVELADNGKTGETECN